TDEPTRDIDVGDFGPGEEHGLSTGELAEIEADDARRVEGRRTEPPMGGGQPPDPWSDDAAADDDRFDHDVFDDDVFDGDHFDGESGPSPDRFGSRFRPVEDGDGQRDMKTAVGVGVGLAAVALLALVISPAVMVGLVTIVLGLAALEWFNVLDNAEWESAGLLGAGAWVALPLRLYWRGPLG